MMAEIALLHKAIRPQGLHQLIFFEYAPRVPDKVEEKVERFPGEQDHPAVAHQRLLRNI